MPVNYTSMQLGGITNLTVLATIKEGFVESFESCTHVYRLQQVLRTLNAIRQAARESALTPSPFPDPVGRFDIVHFFRFTIVPPDPAADGGTSRHRLLLNVTFDGGWEPYMRVIWRDLGTLLDLMFCHCEGYPLSRRNPCETYMAWVRAHEVQGGFLFAESAVSVLDQRVLRQRDLPASPRPALTGAALLDRLTPVQRRAVAEGGLRTMRAFQGLAPFFPLNAAQDEGILRRGMHDVLQDLLAYGVRRLLPAEDPLRRSAEPLITWFERPDTTIAPPAPTVDTPPAITDVQGGILRSYADVTHGALVLLRVDNAALALDTLAHWPVTSEALADDGRRLRFNVALTFQGLRALGVSPARLDRLPQEFIDGMEARAGILGDLRHNHPEQWRTPFQHDSHDHPARIALSSVHVVVQLRGRFADLPAEQADGRLHPALLPEVERLQGPDTGLRLLAVEPMHRHAVGGVAQDHFGFQDGLSQPALACPAAGTTAPRQQWSDTVPRGELLLGHPNGRGDARVPSRPDTLLDNGTFLVVRKLAQHLDRLERVVADQCARLREAHGAAAPDATALMALMMGRRQDGEALVPRATPGADGNDFDYRSDPQGARCPLQSHVRRANPRDSAAVPRIARRGMSYGPRRGQPLSASGPGAERGLLFMACSASIAEQFETIQRWIAGGNSSGTLSWLNDPFLGVPEPGATRLFRFRIGTQEVTLDLGRDPFVELRWGLYLLMPSLTALRSLRQLAAPPVTAPAPVAAPAAPALPLDFAYWKHRLEDITRRDAAWAAVRACPGGVLRTEYGVLVGSKEAVMAVFRDPNQRYSVHGYGDRMRASVGQGYLGLDGDTGHDRQSRQINAALERISEDQAFDLTCRIAAQLIAAARQQQAPADQPQGLPLDLGELSERVLAGLCSVWFGLPDPAHRYMVPDGWRPDRRTVPSCPGHFLSASKFIFSPRPSETVRDYGQEHGRLLHQTVADFLRDPGAVRGPLTQVIVQAIAEIGGSEEQIANTVTGIMLGFPPTVYGNLRSVLARWVAERTLWDLQARLHDSGATPGANAYLRANASLRKALVDAMMRRPVPEMVWRTARSDHRLGQVDVREGDRLVVGICSASQADVLAGVADVGTVFGGYRTPSASGEPAPMHGCPGYGMAMGVMLGLIATLLDAGTLRPTSAPLTLRLMPPGT